MCGEQHLLPNDSSHLENIRRSLWHFSPLPGKASYLHLGRQALAMGSRPCAPP